MIAMEGQTTPAPPTPPAPPPQEPAQPEVPGGRLVQGPVLRAGIIVIGVLLLSAAVLLRVLGLVDPASFPSAEGHTNFVRIVVSMSAILVDVAMFLLLMFALLVGVQRTDLSDSTRKAFMAFALILFISWFLVVLFQSRAVPFFFP
ncbi:MAG: hypothetical protein ACE5LS_00940 [Thermoplasmata archaeon]